MTHKYANLNTRRALLLAAAFGTAASAALAQGGQPAGQSTGRRSGYQYSSALPISGALSLPSVPATTPITPGGVVAENVIARVNDQIITRTEYERAQQQLVQDAQQHQTSQGELSDAQGNLLRDMIDRQLLLSKGKELGISGDAETIRQLDELRKQNHLADLDALQKAVEAQGISYEDFKNNIRSQAITQQVVREEVGRHVNMSRAQEQQYYDQHVKDFEQPEQIHLSEILVPTAEGATEAQLAEAQAKANSIEAKLKGGANFAETAKASSGGPTASVGGDLGDFKRGTLGDVLEKATFGLPAGQFTAPIRTRQGYVILRVDSHQTAGPQPLDAVEGQVQEAIYLDQLQPALRAYLSKARTEAYLEVDTKDGFVDSGSPHTESRPVFTTYAPPPVKKKIIKHQEEETKKAAAAQAQLAAEREKQAAKVAAKSAAQASKQGGVQNASGKPPKPPRVHREKIRYGQAPRNSLPSAPAETAQEAGPAIQGQAPGQAMASNTPASTVVTTGTGPDIDSNPLAEQAPAVRKTHFAQHQFDTDDKRAEQKLAKAEVKASIRPGAATAADSADEKTQAAPLGLNGDTAKKAPKQKHQKGEPKQRIEEKSKPAPAAAPAGTVNPSLGSGATPAAAGAPADSGAVQANPDAAKPAPSTPTTLPPTYTGAPGAPVQGQPIPAATSATPGAPNTVPTPH